MGGKSIIGKSMILGTKVKKALACFEEDFDIPAFSIDPDDLFFTEGHICTDQSQPVFSVGTVSDTDNPCVNRMAVFLILSNLYRN